MIKEIKEFVMGKRKTKKKAVKTATQIETKCGIAVKQFSKRGELIAEFASETVAARATDSKIEDILMDSDSKFDWK